MFLNMTTKAYVIATALVALMVVGSVPMLGLAVADRGDDHNGDKNLNLNNAGNGGNGGRGGDGGNGGDANHCAYCKGGEGGAGGDANGGDGGSHNGNDNHQKIIDKHR
jgi:hypothetical protein